MLQSNPTSAADALEALGLLEARWQAVLDSAQDAIISIDQHGTVTLFNRAAEQMFGYSPDEVLGRNLVMLMPTPHQDEHAEYVACNEGTGDARVIGRVRDVQARRKSGEAFPIEVSVSEGRHGTGRIYTAIIRDVGERARMQAQLRELQERDRLRERQVDLSAISAQLAHDFGKPLAAVSMQAQLLVRRLEKGAAVAQLLPTAKQVLGAIHRLDEIVQEFTSFACEQRLELSDVPVPDRLRLLRDL